MDSLGSDYIKSEKQRKHNNYLKIRKTAKRGLKITFGEIFLKILLKLNSVFLLWCLGGGFLQWFFEALFFTMLLKPEFDPPVKSIQDFMDRNMTLCKFCYLPYWVGGLGDIFFHFNFYSKVH